MPLLACRVGVCGLWLRSGARPVSREATESRPYAFTPRLMLLVDGRLNALITPRPARPAVVKAFIAMYCETGEVDVGLDI